MHRRRSRPYELVSTVQSSLFGGKVSVGDSCFTGFDNVALCTDATAANPVKCNPAYGCLSISGFSDDIISFHLRLGRLDEDRRQLDR